MRIGYCVQGAADEAFVRGLRDRYCPGAKLVQGETRGRSGLSLRRELKKNLIVLTSKSCCDYVVILTDADEDPWRDVYNREWKKVPEEFRHLAIFGVAERNIECWIALDKRVLADEIGCNESEIPSHDPSHFIDRRFGISSRAQLKEEGKDRLASFVRNAPFNVWVTNSKSFRHFWTQIRDVGKRDGCSIPNEQNP